MVSRHLLVQTDAGNIQHAISKDGLLMLGSGTSGTLFIEGLCFIRTLNEDFLLALYYE